MNGKFFHRVIVVVLVLIAHGFTCYNAGRKSNLDETERIQNEAIASQEEAIEEIERSTGLIKEYQGLIHQWRLDRQPQGDLPSYAI